MEHVDRIRDKLTNSNVSELIYLQYGLSHINHTGCAIRIKVKPYIHPCKDMRGGVVQCCCCGETGAPLGKKLRLCGRCNIPYLMMLIKIIIIMAKIS